MTPIPAQVGWNARRGAQACQAARTADKPERMAERRRRCGAPDREAGTADKLTWVPGDWKAGPDTPPDPLHIPKWRKKRNASQE